MAEKDNSKKPKRILLLFYVVIILLPVMIYFSVHEYTLQYTMDQVTETQRIVVENELSRLRASLDYCESYSDTLSSIQLTSNYLMTGKENMKRLVASIQSLHESFPIFYDINGYLSDPFLYSTTSDTMINRLSSFIDLPLHYNLIFSLEPTNYAEFSDRYLQENSNRKITLIGNQSYYVRRIIEGLGHTGKLFFPIDMDKAIDHIYQTMGIPDMSILLSYQGGDLIYSGMTMEQAQELLSLTEKADSAYQSVKVRGTKQILYTIPVEKYNFVLYTMIPKSYFTQSAYTVSFRILRNTIPLFVLCMVLLIIVLRTSHKPMKRIIVSMPEHPVARSVNPFRLVEQSFNELTSANQAKELQLQNSHQNLMEAAVSLLLYQNSNSPYPLHSVLDELNASLDADRYRVLLLVLLGASEDASPAGNVQPVPYTEQLLTRIREFAIEYAPSITYLKMNTPEEMVFLSRQDEDKPFAALQDELIMLCRQITQLTAYDVKIYVGSEVNRLEDVHHSYKEARNTLITRMPGAGYLVVSQDSEHHVSYDYQSEDSKYLRIMAGMSDTVAIDEKLDEIYRRNSHENARSSFEYLIMYTHMLNNLIEAGYKGKLDSSFTNNLSEMSPKVFFSYIKDFYHILCEENMQATQERQQHLTQDIMQSIQSEYCRYDFSITDIVNSFGVSERKAAAIIKQESGYSFPEYIEKLRIDRAVELLSTTDRKISDIALGIGYGNDQSFRRAFKRVTGKTPTDYRK